MLDELKQAAREIQSAKSRIENASAQVASPVAGRRLSQIAEEINASFVTLIRLIGGFQKEQEGNPQ